MLFQHNMGITQQLIPIAKRSTNNVHKKNDLIMPFMWLKTISVIGDLNVPQKQNLLYGVCYMYLKFHILY